jgi:hypothetical protein
MMSKAWIGVDLDGTLAHYDEWRGPDHIGEPVPAMVERVKKWIEMYGPEGVKIFTARVDGGEVALSMGNKEGEHFKDVERMKQLIRDWCQKHIGVRLEVTNKKDYGMIALWDDRAVRVIPNTGQPCCCNHT